MTQIQRSTNNSRNEGNFIKGMQEEQRNRYLLQSIATYHTTLLIPFIQITKHDRYFREIHYTINNGIDPIYNGVTYTARSNSNFLMRSTYTRRIRYVKEFIATCNAKYLIPFIHITGHDEKFREIHYAINTSPKKEKS